MKRPVKRLSAAFALAAALLTPAQTRAAEPTYLSPTALAASPEGKALFIACGTANEVAVFDIATSKVTRRVSVPAPPTGLALSADGSRLYVTCAAPASRVCVIDTAKGKIVDTLPAGHSATGPVLSPDGKTLFVCNRFNDDVSFLDLASKKEIRRVAVQREPVAAAITADGKFLLVANLLHNGRADADYVAAVVSVIDVTTGKVTKELQ